MLCCLLIFLSLKLVNAVIEGVNSFRLLRHKKLLLQWMHRQSQLQLFLSGNSRAMKNNHLKAALPRSHFLHSVWHQKKTSSKVTRVIKQKRRKMSIKKRQKKIRRISLKMRRKRTRHVSPSEHHRRLQLRVVFPLDWLAVVILNHQQHRYSHLVKQLQRIQQRKTAMKQLRHLSECYADLITLDMARLLSLERGTFKWHIGSSFVDLHLFSS